MPGKFVQKLMRGTCDITLILTIKLIAHGPGGGGGTLIFSRIRRLGPFFGVQNSELQYFWGFSEN